MVLPHSVYLWAMQCWGTAPKLRVSPSSNQVDRQTSQPSLTLLRQPFWHVPDMRGKHMHIVKHRDSVQLHWGHLSGQQLVTCLNRYSAFGLFLQILLEKVHSTRRTLHQITFIRVWKGRIQVPVQPLLVCHLPKAFLAFTLMILSSFKSRMHLD